MLVINVRAPGGELATDNGHILIVYIGILLFEESYFRTSASFNIQTKCFGTRTKYFGMYMEFVTEPFSTDYPIARNLWYQCRC